MFKVCRTVKNFWSTFYNPPEFNIQTLWNQIKFHQTYRSQSTRQTCRDCSLTLQQTTCFRFSHPWMWRTLPCSTAKCRLTTTNRSKSRRIYRDKRQFRVQTWLDCCLQSSGLNLHRYKLQRLISQFSRDRQQLRQLI